MLDPTPWGGVTSGVTSVTRGVPLESRYALFIWPAPNGPHFGNLQPPLGCRTGPPTRDHHWVPQVIGCPGVLLPRGFRGRLLANTHDRQRSWEPRAPKIGGAARWLTHSRPPTPSGMRERLNGTLTCEGPFNMDQQPQGGENIPRAPRGFSGGSDASEAPGPTRGGAPATGYLAVPSHHGLAECAVIF